jgi:hypothetical protein
MFVEDQSSLSLFHTMPDAQQCFDTPDTTIPPMSSAECKDSWQNHHNEGVFLSQQANIKRINSESSQAPNRIWLLEIPCTFKEDTPCNMTSGLQECACTYRMK